MPDFEVRPLTGDERPFPSAGPSAEARDGPPDRLVFGHGRADRPTVRERLRRLPGVRLVAGRPVPRVAVAVISALVSGAAVAVYLQAGEQPPVDPPPPQPPSVLEPESWLDVRDFRFPDQHQDGEQVAREAARHPSDALLMVPLTAMDVNLHGLPPGSYEMRATCQPADGTGPGPVTLDAYHPDERSPISMELPCDGSMQVRPDPLVLTDYRAYTLYYYPATESTAPWPEAGELPVVVVSFTPRD